jgi:hypothetical protein
MGFIEQTSSRSATEDGPTQRCGSKVGQWAARVRGQRP